MIASGYQTDGDALGAVERLRLLGVDNVPEYVQTVTERFITNSRDLGEIRGASHTVGWLGTTHADYGTLPPRRRHIMSQNIPPPPPNSLPESPRIRRDSRYQRPKKYVSWWGLVFGLTLGIIGGLVYAWVISPVEEFDTEAYQLRAEDKAQYVVAIMLQYNHDSDLGSAVNRLIELRVGDDPIQSVADIACDLARRGYVETTSGLNAVRIMKTFYQLQGRSGCADTLIPDVEDVPVVTIEVPTATPTLVPPPTKTPTPQSNFASPTPDFVVVPTNPPQRDYDGRIVGTTCSLQTSGLIEVFVQSFDGEGIPR